MLPIRSGGKVQPAPLRIEERLGEEGEAAWPGMQVVRGEVGPAAESVSPRKFEARTAAYRGLAGDPARGRLRRSFSIGCGVRRRQHRRSPEAPGGDRGAAAGERTPGPIRNRVLEAEVVDLKNENSLESGGIPGAARPRDESEGTRPSTRSSRSDGRGGPARSGGWSRRRGAGRRFGGERPKQYAELAGAADAGVRRRAPRGGRPGEGGDSWVLPPGDRTRASLDLRFSLDVRLAKAAGTADDR